MGYFRRLLSLCGFLSALFFCIAPLTHAASPLLGKQILVFSKSSSYRQTAVLHGQTAFMALAAQHGFSVTFTEDARYFSDHSLKPFDAIVFLNTTGDIFDPTQQAVFERFIRANKGLLAIHSAVEGETDGAWPWYGQLIGAQSASRTPTLTARLIVADRQNSMLRKNLGLVKSRNIWLSDKWYSYRAVSPSIKSIMLIDPRSYGAKSKSLRPIVWSHHHDGGRAFYIGLGYRHDMYEHKLMRGLLVEGMIFAVGEKKPAQDPL